MASFRRRRSRGASSTVRSWSVCRRTPSSRPSTSARATAPRSAPTRTSPRRSVGCPERRPCCMSTSMASWLRCRGSFPTTSISSSSSRAGRTSSRSPRWSRGALPPTQCRRIASSSGSPDAKESDKNSRPGLTATRRRVYKVSETSLKPSGSGGVSLLCPRSLCRPAVCVTIARPAEPSPSPPRTRCDMKKHVVQTEALEIVDEQGHVRLRLGISHDQQPFISMLDLSGVVRARFGVQGDGAAGIAIGDENGKIRATMGLASDGSASLAFGDKNGRMRAKFGLSQDASPTMEIEVEDGELHHQNRLAEQGTPTLGLYDQRGKARIRLGLTAAGAPVMRLLDHEGTVRALVGLANDESPFVQFLDGSGKKAVWTQR